MDKSKISINLNGKVILITGASKGIGAECAKLLANAGARVIVHYYKHEKEANEIVRVINNFGGDAFLVAADLSMKSEVLNLFKVIKNKYNQLDVLINNAGIMMPNLLTMITDEELDKQINLNVKGTLFCMQRAARIMSRQQSGKIINMSSIIGSHGTPGHTAYASSKGAVISLTKSAAKELGTYGITVNCITPGIVQTDLIADIKEEALSQITKKIALNRIGQPEDIANVVLFLSSSLSDYISGQILGVDGCYSI